MNKGFFVAVLGVVLGAMVLIFFNQTSTPVGGSVSTPVTGSAIAASRTSGGAVSGTVSPSTQQPSPAQPQTVAPKPAPAQAVAPKPAPQSAQPAEAPAPQPERTKLAQSATDSRSAVQTPAAPPVPVRTEAPKPVPAPKPAEPAKPETPAPAPKPSRPEPEEVRKPASTPSTQATAPQKGVLALKNIGLHFRDNGMALRIEADGPFSYRTFALPTPERYVVDLVGNWSNMRAPSVPSNLLIKSVRLGNQGSGPRLVLDLQRSLKKHDIVQVAPNILEFRLQ